MIPVALLMPSALVLHTFTAMMFAHHATTSGLDRVDAGYLVGMMLIGHSVATTVLFLVFR